MQIYRSGILFLCGIYIRYLENRSEVMILYDIVCINKYEMKINESMIY